MDISKNRSLKWSMRIGVVTAVTAVVMMVIIGSKSGLVSGGFPLSDGEVNQVVLHAENYPTSLGGASYGDADNNHVRNVDFDYFGAKLSAGNHIELASNGFIGNDQGTRLTSITSITVIYSASASMKIATSNRNDGLGLNEKIDIASGVAFVPTNAPYFFRLYAGDVVTQVTSVDICYTCIAQPSNTYFLENLSEQFSGSYGGVDFLLTRNGSSAVLETLNLASNIVLNDGVISLSGDEITVTATDLTYVGELSDNGHLISYVSASGAYAAPLTGLNLNAVYNLEDYESFSEAGLGTGLGIRSAATGKYGHTGLRAAYYSDYYSGSSGSPLGGSGWSLMASSDYLDRFTDSVNVHSGSVAGKYKRGSAGAMRHISWDLYTGNALVVGKGDTFSFWAKGVASNVEVKPRVAHVPLIHASNQTSTSDTTTATFTILANSDWTQYSFPISSAKQVYGFQFSFSSSGTTVYVPVDDVQIYTTANPWSEYVAPVPVSGVSVSPETMNLKVGQNGNVSATVSPENATNKNVSWSSEDENVATVNSSGQVSAIGVGETVITAMTADGSYEDACLVTVSAVSADSDSPLTRSFSGNTVIHHPFYGDMNANVVIALGVGYQAYINAGGTIIRSTYTIEDNVVTIVTGDSNYGTFVGTLNVTQNILTKNSISGEYGAYTDDLIMNAASTILEDGNNTTTSALQSKYIIQYDWDWKTSGSTDRIEYRTSTPAPIEGDGSVALKNGTFGKIRYKSADMSVSLGTFKGLGIWVYNDTGASIAAQMFVYEVNGENYKDFATFTMPSNSTWTYYNSGFASKAVAGYSIILPSANATGHPCIDYVHLF